MDRIDQLVSEWQAEAPEFDVAAMEIVGRVIVLGQFLEARANALLKPLGLSYTDFDVLATLMRSGKPYALTPTALRRSVLITSGAMTAALDRLETGGLIVREPNPDDRRSLTARLTADGRRLARKAARLRFADALESIAHLSAADRNRLAGLLSLLLAAPPFVATASS